MPIPFMKSNAVKNLILTRSGIETDPVKVAEANSGELAKAGCADLLRIYLRETHGIDAAGLTDDSVVEGVCRGSLTLRDGRVQNLSTGDLDTLFSGIAEVAGLEGFRNAAVTWPKIAAKASVTNTKNVNIGLTSECTQISVIPEGQAPKLGNLSGAMVPVRLDKVGRALLISEAAMINDSINLVASTPQRMGRGISRFINAAVYQLLMTNANTPEDGLPVFCIQHGNLQPAAALDETSLGLAIAAMSRQTLRSPDGETVVRDCVKPRWLVVGPQDAVVARKLTGANYSGGSAEWPLDCLVEPLLETAGGHPWYLAADPAQIQSVAVATLAGRPAPTMLSRLGGAGEARGIVVDIQHFVKAVVLDHRGLVWNPGL